ncbi:MAG: glutamate racemase [Patescibacteria group bacterium]|nr:glutamate racemase [Patescibacteria group bacterium]
MIGIFDSGIGGLTVARELMRQIPEAGIIYFGDTARYPYGNKSKQTIERYALQDAHFLISQGAKIIVVACNTASALAIDALQAEISLPLFEVITPAVEKAVRVTASKNVGVIGTRGTVNSSIYASKIHDIDPQIKVASQACPLFVPLVEEGWLRRPETKKIVRAYLAPLKAQGIDTLILGCTHYPLLKSQIQEKIGRRVKLVDSAEEVVSRIVEYIKNNPAIKNQITGQSRFYLSDVSSHTEGIASKWLGRAVKFEQAVVE